MTVSLDQVKAPAESRLRDLLQDVLAGLVTSSLSIAFSLATGALIFSGPLEPFLGRGVEVSLVTGAVAAIVTALLSGFRIAIAAPQSNVAAPIAAIMGALGPTMVRLPPGQTLSLAYAVIGLGTLVTAAAFLTIGAARLGRLVRFIPFPVVAGFMGITGWLLIAGGFKLSTGVVMEPAAFIAFEEPAALSLLVMTVLWTAVLAIAMRRFASPFTMPILFLAAIVVTDLALPFFGISLERAHHWGILFTSVSLELPHLPLTSSAYAGVDWSMLLPVLGDLGGLALIAVLSTLLTFTNFETSLGQDVDFDHELRVQGFASLASGLLGGFISLVSIGSTMAARASGGRGRLAGLTAGLVCLGMLFGGLGIVGYVPRFVVGGLLLQSGLRLLRVWVWDSRRQMSRAEWLLVVLIVAVTACFGFLSAILCGIVGGCIVFAVDVSRIDIVRRIYGLNERPSSLVRSTEEMAALTRHGAAVQVVELTGYVFFGSAYRLLEHVRRRLLPRKPDRLIFDYSAVTGFDSSAAAVMARLRGLLRSEGIGCSLVPPDVPLPMQMRIAGSLDKDMLVFADRDAALEGGEQYVVATYAPDLGREKMETWLARALASSAHATTLLALLQPMLYERGDYLCRQGAPTDTLLFIESGRVNVMVGGSSEPERCVRVFGPHTVTGEHGFVLGLPRTASLQVEEPSKVWSLERRVFQRLQKDDPDLVIALMRHIVQIQSERLAFATRQNVALAG